MTALHQIITNDELEHCIKGISVNYFTTLKVLEELKKNYPEKIEMIKAFSPRNYRAVVGKSIKKFSVETNIIKQISGVKESPARWQKN